MAPAYFKLTQDTKDALARYAHTATISQANFLEHLVQTYGAQLVRDLQFLAERKARAETAEGSADTVEVPTAGA